MKTKLLHWGFIWMAAATIFSSCEDDEKTKAIPEVTTSAVTDVTAISATGGGEITSDGNAEITARGLVYSNTNAMPTLSDSKTEATGTNDSFTSDLEGLASGVAYHVRAYATNSIGTGYGEVVDFTTNNLAPTATEVAIDGTVEVDQEVTASYTYDDAEDDTQSGTTFQWYIADDIAGSGEVAIGGATSASYTIDVSYEFKYLRVGVTPKSSAGTTTGVEVRSEFSQVAASTTKVHFIYNGQEVAYGIITSPSTGRQWLDRNLGAVSPATSYLDHLAYGDLFQWGRSADGHQLITWTASDAGTPTNGTTPTKFTTDFPGSVLFYVDATNASSPFDWRSPQNDNLWQASSQVNNPCPEGWHIPTNTEWEAETAGNQVVGDVLKLTAPGWRRQDNGNIDGLSTTYPAGKYWSSTPAEASGQKFGQYFQIRIVRASNTILNDLEYEDYGVRAIGYSCRCIKDE
jgi:uncharacterized protein (TIGR02145 family)